MSARGVIRDAVGCGYLAARWPSDAARDDDLEANGAVDVDP
jgi:hypothetical protein